MKIYSYTLNDYQRIMEIWDSAVLATHHFLDQDYFLKLKEIIPNEFLPQLDLFVIEDEGIKGFMAIASDRLEMLFVDGSARGKGYGSRLLAYAVNELGVTKVDVNEQNEQARHFYLAKHFVVASRTEKDSLGYDYPILKLSLRSKS